MELNEYQKQAMTTCMDSCRNIPYMLFNLGYGRVFTADITNGCCEYINIDKSK